MVIKKPIGILFVCLANICRSPMAEAILKNDIKKEGLQYRIYVGSASIENWLSGKEAHPQVLKVLDEHHIPHQRLISRQLKKRDGRWYDLIICMDHQVLEAAKKIIGPENEEKIYLFNEFLGENTDVEDPIKTKDFEKAYQDIDRGDKAILKAVKKTYQL